MSDVPAAALWLVAIAFVADDRRPALFCAGLAAGAAVLVRPNLAPLSMILGGFAAFVQWQRSRRVLDACVRAGVFAVGLVPAAMMVAVVQQWLYGSPFSSGYGRLDALFRLDHVGANLARYPRWLIETHSVLPAIGLLAPVVLTWRHARHGTGQHPAFAWTLWLFSMAAFAAYLPYVPFDGWWFLRFWLPGIAPVLVLGVCTAAVPLGLAPATPAARTATPATAGAPHRMRHPAHGPGASRVLITWLLLIAGVALSAWQLGVARDRAVFQLQRFERKFVATGEYVAKLPSTAVVLTVWHSGAVNYYGEKPSVAWDAIDPDRLDEVVASLQRQHRDVYLLLEPREEDAFRARFHQSSTYGRLDWPALARFSSEASLWSLADRGRFLRGEHTPSERVWIE